VQAIVIFLFIAGLLNLAGGVLSVVSWPFVRRKYKKKPMLRKKTKASIIIPSKGNLNIKYFMEQKYDDYEIIVIVDSEEEKEDLERRIGGEKVRIAISKKFEGCSGKNAALITGIEIAKGEVLVFADDDIKPHPRWLYYLVASLQDASTTYRWYFKNPLLCVWNAAITAILFYKRFGFAWGGSTAIRKEVFERNGIKDVWKRELVDDLTLTKILKERGYEIKFVPQAIAESEEEKEIFKWMSKQFAWVRHYFPFLWKVALFFNLGMRVSNVAGLVVLFFYPTIGLLLLSSLLFDFIRGWQEYHTFVTLMEYPKEKFLSPAYHIVFRPVASFIISYNLLSSAFIKRVEWKGKKYSIPKVSLQRRF